LGIVHDEPESQCEPLACKLSPGVTAAAADKPFFRELSRFCKKWSAGQK